MNNTKANELMTEFLDTMCRHIVTMCPENYKAEFIKCLETNNAKRAEEIIDEIMSIS